MKRAVIYSFVAFLLALSLVSFNSLFLEAPLKQRGDAPSLAKIETVKDTDVAPYVSDLNFLNPSYIFFISFLLAMSVYVSIKKFRNYS
ncbi:MAG: hypothetical protein NWE86_08010 [Candidatus Bathyarchaeota archaeon]|nr:hypothetical protein [Candidatus Bathyarchaeota archaeon]